MSNHSAPLPNPPAHYQPPLPIANSTARPNYAAVVRGPAQPPPRPPRRVQQWHSSVKDTRQNASIQHIPIINQTPAAHPSNGHYIRQTAVGPITVIPTDQTVVDKAGRTVKRFYFPQLNDNRGALGTLEELELHCQSLIVRPIAKSAPAPAPLLLPLAAPLPVPPPSAPPMVSATSPAQYKLSSPSKIPLNIHKPVPQVPISEQSVFTEEPMSMDARPATPARYTLPPIRSSALTSSFSLANVRDVVSNIVSSTSKSARRSLDTHIAKAVATPPETPASNRKQKPIITPQKPLPLQTPPPSIEVQHVANSKGVPLKHPPLDPRVLSKYTIIEELGSGGFGLVLKAVRKSDGKEVAIKLIWISRVPKYGWVSFDKGPDRPSLRILSEAWILKNCKHPGIVEFHELLEDQWRYYLIMGFHGAPWTSSKMDDDEACSAPEDTPPSPSPQVHSFANDLLTPPRPIPVRRSSCDLFEAVEELSRFTEDDARKIFGQLVGIVSYLASKGVYHRDIKDENIVIDKQLNVKLVDFGAASYFGPQTPPAIIKDFRGTTSFAAYEILHEQPYHLPQTEVWALGIVLCILVNGESLFDDKVNIMKYKMSKPRYKLTNDCMSLIHRCLDIDAKRRITLAEICKHPWMTKASLDKEAMTVIARRSANLSLTGPPDFTAYRFPTAPATQMSKQPQGTTSRKSNGHPYAHPLSLSRPPELYGKRF